MLVGLRHDVAYVSARQDVVDPGPQPPRHLPALAHSLFAPRPQRSATRSAFNDHALRIAASVLIVMGIWVGAGAVRTNRKMTVQQDAESTATLTAENRSLSGEAAAKVAPSTGGGPVNWLRHNIASRASLQVREDFTQGMQSWGTDAKAQPAGWSRSADGYVRTGALALFRPTVKFSDYRMEFFGQIESTGSPFSACDSETCRWQIEHGTGAPSLHPIEVLLMAYDGAT